MACRLGSRDAYRRVIHLVGEENLPIATRKDVLRILDEMGDTDCVPAVLFLLCGSRDDVLKSAALATLSHFDEPPIAETVLKAYSQLSRPVRSQARSLLFGRTDWARRLLTAIDHGKIPATDVEMDKLAACRALERW